eukprot:Anaeramoba_ignava/a217643_27.p1 GENE.a217643_27~~a217643_27.p1  ORF type:complete len:1308 (-),score=456.18 a217643_27:44-3631(-)
MNHLDTFKVLWVYDPKNRQNCIENPFHLAAKFGFPEIMKYMFENSDESEQNQFNENGLLPVHVAALEGKVEILQFLASKGYSLNEKSKTLQTPLHYACEASQTQVVIFLINQKVPLNEKDQDERTPLFISHQKKDHEIAQLLLKKKAINPILTFLITDNYSGFLNFLKKFEVNLEVTDSSGSFPIHRAAMKGSLEFLELVLKNGVNINTVDKRKCTALHLATRNGYFEAAKFLVENKADIHIKNEDGQTALHLATSYGHIDLLKYIFDQGGNLHEKDSKGNTLLHLSTATHNYSIFEYILSKSADLFAKNNKEQTIIHSAAKNGFTQLIENLLQQKSSKKLNINAKDSNGKTPLILAVKNQHTETVRKLLLLKANVNIADSSGLLPIMYAIKKENVVILEILLENKAKLKMSKEIKTPILHFAVQNNKKTDCIAKLLKYGAKAMKKDKKGNLPSHEAAILGKFEILEFLIKIGIHIDAKNNEKNRVLHLLVIENRPEDVLKLFTLGPKVSARNIKNKTPLHFACENGYYECAKILLEKKAKTDIRDTQGNNPAMIAFNTKHYEILHLLSEYNSPIPLIDVMNAGNVSAARELIEQGFPVDVAGQDGNTPVHLVFLKKIPELVDLILEKSKDINQKNKGEYYPIQYAAKWVEPQICANLLRRGASLVGYFGKDLFPHIIAEKNKAPCAEMLKKEFLRTTAVFELVSTENNYVNSLQAGVDLFIKPLNEYRILKKEEIATIFMNLEDILVETRKFSDKLNEKVKAWSIDSKIGDILTQNVQMLHHYKKYNALFEKSRNMIKRKMNKSQFGNFVKDAESKVGEKSQKKVNLATILINPVQRPGQYGILIQAILKKTPQDHPDFPLVTEAHEKFQSLILDLNESQRRNENLQRISEIEKLIQGKPPSIILDSSSHRLLVHEGRIHAFNITSTHRQKTGIGSKISNITQKTYQSSISSLIDRVSIEVQKEIQQKENEMKEKENKADEIPKVLKHLFLFNDLLVITDKTSENYKHEKTIPIISVFLEQNTSNPVYTSLNAFSIVTPYGRYAFSCSSKEEKKQWCLGFQKAIVEAEKLYSEHMKWKLEENQLFNMTSFDLSSFKARTSSVQDSLFRSHVTQKSKPFILWNCDCYYVSHVNKKIQVEFSNFVGVSTSSDSFEEKVYMQIERKIKKPPRSDEVRMLITDLSLVENDIFLYESHL